MRGAQLKQQAILLRLFARAVIADALPSSAAADCLASTCTLAGATSSRPVPSLFSRLLWTPSGPGCALPKSVLRPQAFLLNGSLENFRGGPEGSHSLRFARGAKINGSEVKPGFIIMRKGRITQVLKTQHTQQGRGGATIQVELRDVQSGLKSSERLRTGEAIEKVFVDDRPYSYLYTEGEIVYLMEPNTFEQLDIPKSFFGPAAAYLTDGMEVKVQYFDGKPLSATVPDRVTCTVTEAEPYFKGQTATPQYKRIVLDNGLQIMAPSFVVAGDKVVVDTTENLYMTRYVITSFLQFTLPVQSKHIVPSEWNFVSRS
ncbi:hypothetical protein R1sor_022096 [Riccia sorocarpa]|uniref:Elongation factor P n=1 Tax=Riccia sorocarpa TaxID=122646 RepID=A0ABD3GIV8_9MARC